MIFLLEFHAEVERERIKAQNALKDIKNIEELIINATNQALQAEKKLNGSENNAEYARKIAQDSQVSIINVIYNVIYDIILYVLNIKYFYIRDMQKKLVQKQTTLELKRIKLKQKQFAQEMKLKNYIKGQIVQIL